MSYAIFFYLIFNAVSHVNFWTFCIDTSWHEHTSWHGDHPEHTSCHIEIQNRDNFRFR